MSGTKAGGIKTAKTNYEKYGKDFTVILAEKVVKTATPAVLQRIRH